MGPDPHDRIMWSAPIPNCSPLPTATNATPLDLFSTQHKTTETHVSVLGSSSHVADMSLGTMSEAKSRTCPFETEKRRKEAHSYGPSARVLSHGHEHITRDAPRLLPFDCAYEVFGSGMRDVRVHVGSFFLQTGVRVGAEEAAKGHCS